MRVGIFRGTVQKPWEWRRGMLTQASTGKQGGCLIKGNINRRKERIYHMPFHQFYGRTRINEAKGERWFCTENEALQAGWRRALSSDAHCGKLGSKSRSLGECWFKFNWKLEFGNEISDQSTHFIDGFGAI